MFEFKCPHCGKEIDYGDMMILIGQALGGKVTEHVDVPTEEDK